MTYTLDENTGEIRAAGEIIALGVGSAMHEAGQLVKWANAGCLSMEVRAGAPLIKHTLELMAEHGTSTSSRIATMLLEFWPLGADHVRFNGSEATYYDEERRAICTLEVPV